MTSVVEYQYWEYKIRMVFASDHVQGNAEVTKWLNSGFPDPFTLSKIDLTFLKLIFLFSCKNPPNFVYPKLIIHNQSHATVQWAAAAWSSLCNLARRSNRQQTKEKQPKKSHSVFPEHSKTRLACLTVECKEQ
jgi:hypothetical protein